MGRVSYREHPHGRGLDPWVAALWTAEVAGRRAHRILPDGCIDLVLVEGALRVVGPASTAQLAEVEGLVVGVRFRPGGAAPVLGIQACELLDATAPAPAVLGVAGARLERSLAACGTAAEAVAALERGLDGLVRDAPRPDPAVGAAVARLAADPGMRVATLASELGLGERTLLRRFDAAVGHGPRRLGRVLRLRRALALAKAEPATSWARVAADAGYADQAHLGRDCRELAGVPPSALVSETS